MALKFEDATFETEVLKSEELVVVDCWAEWCGPCRALGPIIDQLALEYEGSVKIGKVNVDNNPHISHKYSITSIPLILFFKNGEVVDRHIGTCPKNVLNKKIISLQ